MCRNWIHFVLQHFRVQGCDVEWLDRKWKTTCKHGVHIHSSMAGEKGIKVVRHGQERCEPSGLHAPNIHSLVVLLLSKEFRGCVGRAATLRTTVHLRTLVIRHILLVTETKIYTTETRTRRYPICICNPH